MAFTNHETQEINCKILYCGPDGAGKSTNLRSIFMQTSPEIRSGYFVLAPPAPSKPFCFLPLSMGKVGGYHLKLHIYTIAEHLYDSSVAATLIKGLDGLVYVFDSSLESLLPSQQQRKRIISLLTQHGLIESTLPRVVQYNKRDRTDALKTEHLNAVLNPDKVAECQAVAHENVGTLKTLELISKLLLRDIML
jgi:signal recognition particle receptor subunit beta